MKRGILFVLPLTASIVMCCWSMEYAFPPRLTSDPVDFVDGFGLATWSEGGYALVGTLKMTGERYAAVTDIVEIGWNDDYVVLETKMMVQEWHIYVIPTGKIYHCDVNTPPVTPFLEECNSFEEFQALKKEVGVPETLIMRDVNQVWEELNQK